VEPVEAANARRLCYSANAMSDELRVAVIGCGHWGPNLVRNFASLRTVKVSAVCDARAEAVERVAQQQAPGARVFTDYHELLAANLAEAVVIATPPMTHTQLVGDALCAGLHVLVEKPLAMSVTDCQQLAALAEARQRTLMVGHVFRYNDAVIRIKEILDAGDLGDLLYVHSKRVNLGRIQTDLNALWSFAPHDLSILRYWLGADPVRVSARGFSCLHSEVEDVAFVILDYPGHIRAHLHLSWLDPKKVREMTLVGSRQMLVYDDVSADAKLQIHDKGVEAAPDAHSFGELMTHVRAGDLLIPHLTVTEPLRKECTHFVECCRTGATPLTDARDGLAVVRVLEAAAQSMQRDGAIVELA